MATDREVLAQLNALRNPVFPVEQAAFFVDDSPDENDPDDIHEDDPTTGAADEQ